MLANISLRSKRRPQTGIKQIKLLFSMQNTIYKSTIRAEFWLWASSPNNMLIFRVALLTLAWGMRRESLLDLTNEHNLNSSKAHSHTFSTLYIYIIIHSCWWGSTTLTFKGPYQFGKWNLATTLTETRAVHSNMETRPIRLRLYSQAHAKKNWLTNLGRSPLAVANGWSSVKHRMTWNHRTLAQQERHTVRQST